MAINIERTEFLITATDTATRVFKSVQGAIGSLQSAYIALGAAMAVGAVMTKFVADAILVRSALDDMSDTTGDNVKTLDGLRRIAMVAGVEMGQLGGALTKLAKNMNSADDDGKAAGAAILSLGLNIDEVRAKKPGEAMLEIALALNKFDDGAAKVAVAMALMGKSGAAMLPMLKDMAEAGELNGRITGEQARAAEELEKSWRRLKQAFVDGKDAIADGLIPWMTRLIEEMRDGIRIAGGFGSALMLLGSINPFRSVRGNIAALQENIAERAAARQNLGARPGYGAAIAALDRDDASDRQRVEFLKAQQRRAALALAGGDRSFDANDLRARARPKLDFTVPQIDRGGGAKDSGFDALMDGLLKQINLQKESTELEKLTIELARVKYAAILPAQREELQAAAALLDGKLRERKAVEELAKYDEAALDREAVREKLYADLHMAMSQHAADLRAETALIGKSNTERERAVEMLKLEKSWMDAMAKTQAGDIELRERLTESYVRAKKQMETVLDDKAAATLAEERWQKYLTDAKTAAEESSEAWRTAAKDMQRNMSGFFFDLMQGKLSNLGQSFKQTIDKMVSEALAARAAVSLFGPDFAKGGDLGGLASSALSAFGINPARNQLISRGFGVLGTALSLDTYDPSPAAGGLFDSFMGLFRAQGGPVAANMPYVVGERGPEWFMPSQNGTIIPNSGSAGGSGQRAIVINLAVQSNGPVDRRSQTQIAAAAGEGVQRALARNS